jgi:hypothetical protein
MGGSQARTQAAFISTDMGAAEDDAWRRPARPGGSALMLERALRLEQLDGTELSVENPDRALLRLAEERFDLLAVTTSEHG